LIHVTD